ARRHRPGCAGAARRASCGRAAWAGGWGCCRGPAAAGRSAAAAGLPT
nr:hypothetical protein [Tanacetum cinerariifolium]